jgi:hypothetical protein
MANTNEDASIHFRKSRRANAAFGDSWYSLDGNPFSQPKSS